MSLPFGLAPWSLPLVPATMSIRWPGEEREGDGQIQRIAPGLDEHREKTRAGIASLSSLPPARDHTARGAPLYLYHISHILAGVGVLPHHEGPEHGYFAVCFTALVAQSRIQNPSLAFTVPHLSFSHPMATTVTTPRHLAVTFSRKTRMRISETSGK